MRNSFRELLVITSRCELQFQYRNCNKQIILSPTLRMILDIL